MSVWKKIKNIREGKTESMALCKEHVTEYFLTLIKQSKRFALWIVPVKKKRVKCEECGEQAFYRITENPRKKKS